MANFYCEYCGRRYSDVRSLTQSNCHNHPDGYCKGKHKLYEGSEKENYTCKYCGWTASSIQALTQGKCHNHPNGHGKGKHTPAL